MNTPSIRRGRHEERRPRPFIASGVLGPGPTLRGIDDQVAKAEKAVAGKTPVKRNRYTRALARWKGYTTNLTDATAQFVIDAYHQLWRIEKSFRMSKHDLQARPIYHHLRESIAH